MKKTFLLIPLVLIFMFMIKPKKTRIIFFGDSITQMGINKGGYIDLIQQSVNGKNIQQQYELIGAGVGGNKVYDLYLRMEEDVLDKKPNIVVVYEGINDVWHKTSGTGTEIDKYEKFYAAIIKKLRAKNIRVAVCTPALIGEKKDNGNAQDTDLEAYSEVIRRLATSMNCVLIDLHKTFKDYEQLNNKDNKESGLLTTDRVHLTDTGNQLVADEMMKALSIQ
jgi:lysophospholipase L1-like esterase